MSANDNILGDLIKDTASGVTSTTVTLNNTSSTGFQTFGSFYANADRVPSYRITDTTGNWELTGGVYTSSGTTLSRAATPRASSNAGAQVAAFSGTITVAVVDDAAFTDAELPGMASAQLWPMFNLGTVVTTANKTVGIVFYSPVYIGQWFSNVNLHFSISTVFSGTSTTAIGLYSNLNGAPNNRLGQVTGINTGTGGATGDIASGNISLGEVFPPGLYWIATVHTSNMPTTNCFQGAVGTGYVGVRPILGLSSLSSANIIALNTGYAQTNATLPTTASSLIFATSTIPIVAVAAS